MRRQPVHSSNLKSVGWENGTMEVEFHSGKIYRYPATEQQFLSIVRAASPGKTFHRLFGNKRGTKIR